MSYVPLTPRQREDMLKTIGAASVEELFSDIPPALAPRSFNPPPIAPPNTRVRTVDRAVGATRRARS